MKKYPIIPTLILTALAAGGLWQSALAEEPSRRPPGGSFMLVPFEAYPKHREAIGLNEDQMRELGRIAEGMGDAARKLEGEMRARGEALQEAIAKRPIELEKAMERFQAVLQAENEMKALQFRSGVAAQNLLTPEQAEKMRAIAAKVQGSRDPNAGLDPAGLRERLEQLRGELRKRTGGDLNKDAVGALERIEQATQKGNLDDAKKGMEGLLAKLGESRRKESTSQPSAAEIAEQVKKTENDLADVSDPEKRERLQQQLAKLRKTQELLAANPDASRREKSTFKGDDDKGKQPDRQEKGFVKEGDGKDKAAPKKDGENRDKVPLKGDGDTRDKVKFDKNAENPKRPDPELRKRVEGALAEFQEAKAAGNREGMEKITKSIESLLRENAREGSAAKDGSFKDGARKEGGPKDGATKDGARKEGAPKDGERKEGAQKDGERKEGVIKDGARKDGAPKDGERKEGAVKE